MRRAWRRIRRPTTRKSQYRDQATGCCLSRERRIADSIAANRSSFSNILRYVKLHRHQFSTIILFPMFNLAYTYIHIYFFLDINLYVPRFGEWCRFRGGSRTTRIIYLRRSSEAISLRKIQPQAVYMKASESRGKRSISTYLFGCIKEAREVKTLFETRTDVISGWIEWSIRYTSTYRSFFNVLLTII